MVLGALYEKTGTSANILARCDPSELLIVLTTYGNSGSVDIR